MSGDATAGTATTDGSDPDRTRRAVLVLSAWTAVVAVPGLALSGTVAFWDAHDHLARAASGPGAVLAANAVTLFLALVAGAALLLPLVVVYRRAEQRGTSTAATLLGALAGLVAPLALAGFWGLLSGVTVAGAMFVAGVVAAGILVAVPLVGLAARGVARRLRSDSRDDSDSRRAWSLDGTDGPPRPRRSDGGADDPLPWTACCWNYWLVGALVFGAVGGGLVGAPLGGAVETWSGTPQVSFDYETTETADGTRLTITHDGGDAIPADGLRVQGNLTAVPGANQTRAGPWNGSTTHIEQAFRPGQHVAPRDQVSVGVPEGCVVRVVYENRAGDTATLGKYDCEREGEQ
jgi:hypothetical protein